VSYDAVSDLCDVKYVDYGGYSTIEAKELRKIRTDFLSLPFQVTAGSGSAKASGREPKSCLGQNFHFKLDSFLVV